MAGWSSWGHCLRAPTPVTEEELRPGRCQVVVCENTNDSTDREGRVSPQAGERQGAVMGKLPGKDTTTTK
ncbi:unnamed protein product [Caretta caretta]